MICTCRSCGNRRQSYVRQLCKLCYQRLKKQEVRDSPLFDRAMLYPQECTTKYCALFAVNLPGLPMCTDCHEWFYHTTGHFSDFNCQCGLNPAEALE